MNVLWSFLFTAVGFTVTSKRADRDSCFYTMRLAVQRRTKAAEPENRRPFALGDALSGLVTVRLALVIVKPETVIAWDQKGFDCIGAWKE